MKKTVLSLLILIATNQLFACHPIPKGNCTGNAYFELVGSHPNYLFEYQYMDGATIKDSVFTTEDTVPVGFYVPQVSQNVPVTIKWRYSAGVKYPWLAWQTTESLNEADSEICFKVTPVSLSNLTGTLKDNILTTSFVAGAKPIDHYNIQVSNDSINWQTVDREDHAGTFTINLAGKAIAGIGLIGLGFIGFKKKRLIWLAMASLYCIFYVSCQKEIIKSDKTISYKYMRVQEVGTDAVIQNSNVVKL